MSTAAFAFLLGAHVVVRTTFYAARWFGYRRPAGVHRDALLAVAMVVATLTALHLLLEPGWRDAVLRALLAGALVGTALVICAYDLKWLLIPTELTVALGSLGLVGAAMRAPDAWIESCLGGLLMPLMLEITRRAFLALRHVDGLGQGDVKLGAAIGCTVGIWQVGPVIAVASITTLIYALLRHWLGGGAATTVKRVPFAPGLLVAMLLDLGSTQ